MAVKSCPRCGYVGEGVRYFKRPGHVALLVGISAFTYGLGGLAYWIARRKHRVCPSCGLGWELSRIAAVSHPGRPFPGRGPQVGAVVGSRPLSEAEPPLPRRGIGRRVLGVGMALMAAFLIAVGFVEFELAAVAVGSVIGAGGTATFWWGMKAQQERRRALMQRLHRKVLLLAQSRGGSLTVTDVAADLNLSIEAAERVLEQMDDGFRVRSDITDEGIIVYEFPEVMHRARLSDGERSGSRGAGSRTLEDGSAQA